METLPTSRGVPSFDDKLLLNVFNGLDVRVETRKEYSYFLKRFLEFISENTLDINSFRAYKAHLSKRTDLSVSTKNKLLTSARIFLKEMSRTGQLPFDITLNTKCFSQSKKHKKEGLNDDEIELLVEKLRSLPLTAKNCRLKAAICLLGFQGLRQCEVVRLDVSDLDLANKIAYVRGKGMDDKEPVNLHPATATILLEYLKFGKIADGAVFVSWSNNGRNQRMTTNALRMIIKDFLMPLEIHKSVHGFRHYFTTKLIKTYKGDLLEVARYTRHKSLEMLQVYNDNIKLRADLPRFYSAFKGANFAYNGDLGGESGIAASA